MRGIFHLAFPVSDLEKTRDFYGAILGCTEGRSTDRWIDFDFFGHQISAHLADMDDGQEPTNPVDGDTIPVRHFGAILSVSDWETIAVNLRTAGAAFVLDPKTRFAGEPGEQGTFFVRDPSGNVLEFKSFRDPSQIFATDLE
jgi:extradiol dioxygenase family protein